jgi:hypothetical protein
VDPADEAQTGGMADWTCDHCGETGEVPEGETSDDVLCHVCGEPVLPG